MVHGVTLSLAPSNVVVLLGSNGSGKTTLLRLLSGSLEPEAGRVLLDGVDITGVPLHARARLGVGYLPQGASVFAGLTTQHNIEAVLEVRALPRVERRRRVDELVSLFDLAPVARRRAGLLSGGERRRVELARLFALEPRVALLDEPFASLDPEGVEALSGLIAGLAKGGVAVLLAEHHVHRALTIGHHACILVDGRVAASGSPESIGARYGFAIESGHRMSKSWER